MQDLKHYVNRKSRKHDLALLANAIQLRKAIRKIQLAYVLAAQEKNSNSVTANLVDCTRRMKETAFLVGAGIVALTCARALALDGVKVIVLEQHDDFGTETSARNSEVIHAGIY